MNFGIALLDLLILLLAFKEHFLKLSKRHLNQKSANEPESHSNQSNRNVKRKHILDIVVEIQFLHKTGMLDNHVMDQVGPERNLGDKVEQLCVHEEEN